MHLRSVISIISLLLLASCAQTRVTDHPDWGKYYQAQGIQNACFILRDNNHEAIHYFNKERSIQRFLPASTFKIFNSLVALETVVAPDDQLIIKWDGIARRPEWNKDMNMREAFKVSNVPYYQEIARRIGKDRMQHYLDTAKYGNAIIGGAVDAFWLNNTLQISADEQVGLVKRMYFNELPFSERSQRIVRSMMLQEETPAYKLYYKTGTGTDGNKQIFWVVGFIERIQNVKEDKDAMNKSDVRLYPYFFAQNFAVPVGDTSKDWTKIRIDLVHDVLTSYGAMPAGK
jgi:beta-lactamase class D